MPVVNVPGVGDVVLVDREQLRFTLHGRTAAIPRHLSLLAESIPPTPPTFDLSKNETIQYPILGNNRYGDCYYTAMCHMVQTFTHYSKGQQANFNEQDVVRRYLQLSPRDSGLNDHQVYPEWKQGIIGPSGPYKILDELTIDPRDSSTLAMCIWAFGGVLWTCAMNNQWRNGARPSVTWGPVSDQVVGGHAMVLTGKNQRGGYDARTWGISPPVNVTPQGILAADSEIIVVFSLDMFNPSGVGPCGANYDQLAGLWTSLGGSNLPANPFPPSPGLDWFA